MPPMGAAPPAAPPAPGGGPPAPGPFPAASRRRMKDGLLTFNRVSSSQHRLTSQVRRVATARLETVSNELEGIGEALGQEGEEVFSNLADRVRSVTNWIN
jgi:hypothetical protein